MPTPKPQSKAPLIAPFRSIKIAQEKDRLKRFLNQYRENEQAWAYTETALTIFLVAIFIFFAIRPAVTTVTGLVSEIKAKETLVLQIRKKIHSVIQAQDTYAAVQSRHQVLESFLPDTPRYTHAAAQIQGTSQGAALGIQKISFSIPNEKEITKKQRTQKTVQTNIVPVTFSISTSTRYKNMLAFLESIVKNRRLMTLEEFTLSQHRHSVKDESIKEDEILINFKGSAYYWNE